MARSSDALNCNYERNEKSRKQRLEIVASVRQADELREGRYPEVIDLTDRCYEGEWVPHPLRRLSAYALC